MESTNQNIHRAHPATLTFFANATWEFSHYLLWQNKPFSEEEISLTKQYLETHFNSQKAFTKKAYKVFVAFCERILLELDEAANAAPNHLPHPCVWFHPINKKGFARRKKIKQQHTEIRKDTTMTTEKKMIPVKPYNIKELATLYGVHRSTMTEWLSPFKEEIGEKRGRYFLIPQVLIIFKKLGLPSMIDAEGNVE